MVEREEMKKQRGNKYDAKFMNMDREMARKIDSQHTPTKKKKKTAK